MWWSRLATAVLAAFVVGACGFQPLYRAPGGDIRADLAKVHIAPIEDRIGQELRNALRAALQPQGPAPDSEWRLDTKLDESTQRIFVEKSAFATRANLRIRAAFRLIRTNGQEPEAYDGNAIAISSYDILDSEYATLLAERDARSRAVDQLSLDIGNRVAAWLSDRTR